MLMFFYLLSMLTACFLVEQVKQNFDLNEVLATFNLIDIGENDHYYFSHTKDKVYEIKTNYKITTFIPILTI